MFRFTRLNSSLTWKEFGTSIGTSSVSLPTAREYLFVANMGSGVMLTINVPPQYLTGGSRAFRSGYYASAGANASLSIAIENGTAKIENAYLNGNFVTPTCYVYYR